MTYFDATGASRSRRRRRRERENGEFLSLFPTLEGEREKVGLGLDGGWTRTLSPRVRKMPRRRERGWHREESSFVAQRF